LENQVLSFTPLILSFSLREKRRLVLFMPFIKEYAMERWGGIACRKVKALQTLWESTEQARPA
jgi:hypothetical protein